MCRRVLKEVKWCALVLGAVLPFVMVGYAVAQDAQTPASDSGPGVPFDFSHKKHADAKLQCVFCHEEALTAGKATFPREQKCMVCHGAVKTESDAIRQLAAIPRDSRIVPVKTLYKLPEFVYFSHARHADAKIECAKCHGDVFSMDVVELHMPMRMKACVDCHKATSVPGTCTTCHEEIQQ